jgi:hypothetical protein
VLKHKCFIRSVATCVTSSTIVRLASPGLDISLCGTVASQLRIMSPCILLAVGRVTELLFPSHFFPVQSTERFYTSDNVIIPFTISRLMRRGTT